MLTSQIDIDGGTTEVWKHLRHLVLDGTGGASGVLGHDAEEPSP